MYQDRLQIRVRYGETDRMGFVYYGFYSLYFEQARTEAIRKLGLTYKQLEESGVMMPVVRMNVKYVLPAKYDEVLTITTVVPELPTKKMIFEHEIYNEQKDLINIANVELIFMNKNERRVVPIPDSFLMKLTPFFE